MKNIYFFAVTGLILFFSKTGMCQQNNIDFALAQQYFQEARSISERDNGQLWGVKLYGPMMFVHRVTREVVANQVDEEGYLNSKENVFIGTLPKKQGIANMAFSWAGRKWTMVVWPLPDDKFTRAQLMIHELFHRIQDEIGLPANNPSNNHLDEMQGRVWLQLEWQALKEVLQNRGQQQIYDLESALIFRNYRRELYSGSDSTESQLELNEGLAAYTGVKLSGRSKEQVILC